MPLAQMPTAQLHNTEFKKAQATLNAKHKECTNAQMSLAQMPNAQICRTPNTNTYPRPAQAAQGVL